MRTFRLVVGLMLIQAQACWSATTTNAESADRYYVGISTRKLRRKREHLRGQSRWTSRAKDWREVWSTQVAAVRDARALEKRIKGRGAGRFLQDLDYH